MSVSHLSRLDSINRATIERLVWILVLSLFTLDADFLGDKFNIAIQAKHISARIKRTSADSSAKDL